MLKQERVDYILERLQQLYPRPPIPLDHKDPYTLLVAVLLSAQCTDVRVNLGLKAGKYCRMCYRKQLPTGLSAKERQKRCRTSALGCSICKEPICKECWKEGYDKHA